MDSPNKALRKVRFTLPEHENHFVSLITSRNSPAVQVKRQSGHSVPLPVDEIKIHGTSRYINGTLNFVQTELEPVIMENKPKVVQKFENRTGEPIYLRPCIKLPRKSREVKRTTVVESETCSTTKSLPLASSLSKKFHSFMRSRSESRSRKKAELPDR